jgi:hypothetical protein
MNVQRVTAWVLALADSVLGLYVAYAFQASGISGMLLYGLGVVLLVSSLLSLYGVRYAFLLAAVFSVALPADSISALPSMTTPQLAVLALSIASMAANILAFRTGSHLSEQANPMNLPVFG